MRHARITFHYRNLPLLLLRARELLVARFRPLLQSQGITEQQWRVVRLLVEAGSLEPREIGRLCNLSSPSLTGVLARMDALGLVRRRRFETDQRRIAVTLTPRARALAARLAPQIDATYRQLRAQLGDELYTGLLEVMDRVIQRLDVAPAGRRTRRPAARRKQSTRG